MSRPRRISLIILALLLATAVFLEAQTTGPSDVEVQRFVLPGTSNTGLRVHASRTHMDMTLMGRIAANRGYKVAYGYAHPSRIVPGLTNQEMPVQGTAVAGDFTSGVVFQIVPNTGSVIGVAIGATSAITTGTATAEATIRRAGATRATGLTVVIGAGQVNNQFAITTQARDADTFEAGEGVGCRVTTGSTIAPASNQLACTIIVEY